MIKAVALTAVEVQIECSRRPDAGRGSKVP